MGSQAKSTVGREQIELLAYQKWCRSPMRLGVVSGRLCERQELSKKRADVVKRPGGSTTSAYSLASPPLTADCSRISRPIRDVRGQDHPATSRILPVEPRKAIAATLTDGHILVAHEGRSASSRAAPRPVQVAVHGSKYFVYDSFHHSEQRCV
jgi:hypothetical protein